MGISLIQPCAFPQWPKSLSKHNQFFLSVIFFCKSFSGAFWLIPIGSGCCPYYVELLSWNSPQSDTLWFSSSGNRPSILCWGREGAVAWLCSANTSGDFNLTKLPIKSVFWSIFTLTSRAPSIASRLAVWVFCGVTQIDHQYFSTDLPSASRIQHFVAIEIFPILFILEGFIYIYFSTLSTVILWGFGKKQN